MEQSGEIIMKYAFNKEKRKKYYPFYYEDNKVYVLCEAAIYFVGMNNENLVLVTAETEHEQELEIIGQLSCEFQELLVRVAEENQELEQLSNVVSDELKMLRRYIERVQGEDSIRTKLEDSEDNYEAECTETIRMGLRSFIGLLETAEERSKLKVNPAKAMSASFFTFEKYEEDGVEKVKLSRYLGSKKKNLKVPSRYEYLPVSCIGEGAFSYSKYLETVILPECVKEIQEDCFVGINSMKKIVFEETVTDVPPILSVKNKVGDHYLFGVVSGKYLNMLFPEISLDMGREIPISFAENGIIFAEGLQLIKVDLFSREKRQYEMPEILATRLEKTLVETGINNRQFFEESRWLSFFWKELKRYQTAPEDAVCNLDYIVRGLDDSLSCKGLEERICFFMNEKEISIAELLVFAGENCTTKKNEKVQAE